MRKTLLLAALLATGCYTTRREVIPASPPTARPNSIVLEKSKAEVWAKAVPALARNFFVINNLDQASGLVNVSYSGTPARYIEGPVLTYAVVHGTGAEQSRTSFPGTQETARYMIAEGEMVAVVNRSMKLEGRANLIMEEIGPARTRVTANVKYVLTQGRSIEPVGRWIPPAPSSSTISFNTGGSASFSGSDEGMYYATGALEDELLKAFE